MRQLSKMSVRQAAENLFAENGETTCSEVENWLRQRGFQSVPSPLVSDWMSNLCEEFNWETIFDGERQRFRPRQQSASNVLRISFSAN